MAQQLRRKGVRMVPVNFSGKNLDTMATTLKQVLEDRMLEGYEDHEGRLRRDLGRLHIVEKSYGLKLEATSDAEGHADVGTALVIALPRAVALLEGLGLQSDDVIASDPDADPELSPEEIDAMPEEFRELYQMYSQG